MFLYVKSAGFFFICMSTKVWTCHNFTMFHTDMQSPPTVLCDFCGQLFETRKALSCHARAHLRQLGLTWSIRTSPIDLLKEVMLHGEERKELASSGSSASGKTPWTSQGSKRSRDSLPSGEAASSSCMSPVDYSLKEKSSYVKTGISHGGMSVFFIL